MRLRFLPSLVAACALAITGCDAAAPALPSADAVTLDARAATSGDVLYTLAPLDLGERFEVAVGAGDADLRLRSTRTAAGYALDFVPGALRLDSVVVSYLRHGVVVSASESFAGDEPAPAGTAAEGPDSWHYVYRNGSWTIAKDYKNGNIDGGSSTRFTKPSGETIEVSDVVYTVYGLDAPPPRSVRFEAPRDLEVTAQAFGRPMVSADLSR